MRKEGRERKKEEGGRKGKGRRLFTLRKEGRKRKGEYLYIEKERKMIYIEKGRERKEERGFTLRKERREREEEDLHC